MQRRPSVRGGLAALLVSAVALLCLPLGLAVAAPAPAIPAPSTRDDLEIQAIVDVNGARQAHGLAPLRADAQLGALARERSLDMAQHDYFSHYAADGSAYYVQLLDANGIPFTYAGENLAWNTYGDEVSAQTAVNGWIASPSHAANLFCPQYTSAGIGVVSVGGKKFYTLIFLG
jgi:uncharacterized protein YkwD